MKIVQYVLGGFLLLAGCNKSPYLPNNPPTYVELVSNQNTYGLNNNGQPKLQKLKIMTYNIHAGVPPASPGVVNLEQIAQVILAENPDIVFLQEVDKNTGRNGYRKDQAEELGKLTQMNAAFFSATNYLQGFYGQAILSKYPMLQIRKQLLPKGVATEEQRVVGMAVIDLPGIDSVIAMGTHLQHNSAATRLLQVKTLTEFATDFSTPVVMGGDLNEKPDAQAFFTIFDGSFTRTCTGNCPNTFPANNATSVIDYLAFRPARYFSVLQHKVVPETIASDHFPVVSELNINR